MAAIETKELYEITRRTPRSFEGDRLQFVLPDFNRHAWTSELARSTWELRIARILNAWLDVEWLSVAAGIRDCGLLWVYPETLQLLIPKWEAAQLSAIELKFNDYSGNSGRVSAPASVQGMICVVVGTLEKAVQLCEAWQCSDDETIGSLLGYPECCRAFFRQVWIGQRCLDTTWSMAENTSSQTGNGVVRVESGGTPFANILWRWLGVRAVPHLPCRFDCSATIEFAERLLALARNNGYSQEAEWIEEILTWPVEWSALHGIAEIKSPLMKLSTRTDATAGKWVVQWAGTDYPKEGAVGLHFPFRPPKKSRISSLEISTTELRAPVSNDSDQAWRYADNGFRSFTTMEELHQPLLTMAREALAGKSGNVVDLGCGNGILLNKICAGRHDLTPHGIDSNGLALGHARQLQPELAAKFLQGDLFEIESWASGNQRYTLAILMLGRLLEVPTESAMRVLKQLQVSCDQVLVYVYPDWGAHPLAGIAARFGLVLEPSRYQSAAFLK